MIQDIKIRESVRAVVVDERKRVLLSRVAPLGNNNDTKNLWVTLGGRLKEGESRWAALEREMGLKISLPISNIWLGDQVVEWGGQEISLIEHFYLIKVSNTDFKFIGVSDNERDTTQEMRWWSIQQIQSSSDKFVPVNIGELLSTPSMLTSSAPYPVILE